jgi:hypothetical protein
MSRIWKWSPSTPRHFPHTSGGQMAAIKMRREHGGWVVSQDDCYWWTNDVGTAEGLVAPLVDGDQEAARRAVGHPKARELLLDAETARRLARYVCVGECPKDQDGCPDLCTGRKMEPAPFGTATDDGAVSFRAGRPDRPPDFLIKTRIGHNRMSTHGAGTFMMLIVMGEGEATLRIDGYRSDRGRPMLILHYPREGCVPKVSETDNVITFETTH